MRVAVRGVLVHRDSPVGGLAVAGVGESDDRGEREGLRSLRPFRSGDIPARARWSKQPLAVHHLEHAAGIAMTGVEPVRADHADAEDPAGRRSSSHSVISYGLRREPRFRCSGFVYAFHTRSTGASSVRSRTRSFSSAIIVSVFLQGLKIVLEPVELRFPFGAPLGDPAFGGRSVFGSSCTVRTRPFFSDRTSPLSSSAFRCCITAGRLMRHGPASSDNGGGAAREPGKHPAADRIRQRLKGAIELTANR